MSLPDNYDNLSQIAEPSPVQNPDEAPIAHAQSSEDCRRRSGGALKKIESTDTGRKSRRLRHSSAEEYDIPDSYADLDELAAPSPVQNPYEEHIHRHLGLEETRSKEQALKKGRRRESGAASTTGEAQEPTREDIVRHKISKLATQLYVISYLVLFSLLGTLARLGLQAITSYPGAPLVFSELWANFGGSLIMGFLSEDRMLFREEWGTPTYQQQIEKPKQDEENGPNSDIDLQAAKKAHAATKKTIPLYIGLATGFCGSFTSFSSFIRDAFLAMSNGLTSTGPRNGGYSFMALLAVVITTLALCISGLFIGAHLAIASEPYTPSLPFNFGRKILDRVAVFLAWGFWIGAIFLAIFPPDRHNNPPELWLGRAGFALVFAPLGCLGRFYASLYLNGRIASFPLGTFFVNVIGTAILGMSYDLQRVPLGSILGCQVLQGVEDGFCGCLTTVSTWVAELTSLRRKNAYKYGAASVVVALCFSIVIMGSMQWTRGFSELQCMH